MSQPESAQLETTQPAYFADVKDYLSIPRLSSLALSPDGTRLITVVSELVEGGKRRSSLWEIDPLGNKSVRQLTRSSTNESNPSFTPAGALLFLSRRTNPAQSQAKKGDDKPALWLLPSSGEARQLCQA